MKFKFLPLLLAVTCAVLPAVSCSKKAEEFSDSSTAASSLILSEANNHPEQEEFPEESIPEQEETPSDEENGASETGVDSGEDEKGENSNKLENTAAVEEATENAPPVEEEEPAEPSSFILSEANNHPEQEEFPEESIPEQEETPSDEENGASETGADNSEGEKGENSDRAEDTDSTEGEESVESEEPIEKVLYIECICTDLNIRSGAGTSYTSLGKAEKGTLFFYSGTENGWYKTYYKGKEAYISAYSKYTRLIEMEKGDEKAESVISEGVKLIGTKYVYGAVRLHDGYGNFLSGFTPTEFDCSSLMQYIFYRGANVILQVNTRTQIYQGQAVAPSALRRGDCIYFTNSSRCNNTGVERVGHVALYLGDGYILHTASDYCKIEKISESRWNYYIEARRFV